MKEVWKNVKEQFGYKVSNFGNVLSVGRVITLSDGRTKTIKETLLSGFLNKDGYRIVQLGHRKRFQVHRLVAQAFIPNPDNKSQINHKNGIKDDNRVENLEWATASENQLHSVRVLGHVPNKFSVRYGKDNPLSKIVLQIKDGKVIAEFYGASEAERKTKINNSGICMVCRGKRQTAGGYQWKFKE